MLLRLLVIILLVLQTVDAMAVVQNGSSADAEVLPVDLWTRSGTDWANFLGPNRDGSSPEKGILKDWTKGSLKVRWKLPAGQGYAIGAAAGGRFFHFGKTGDDAVLTCVNAESGQLIWEYRYRSDYQDLYGYDAGPRSSPVVDGNRVYILGVEGELHCVRISDGQRVWRVDTTEKFGVVQNFFGAGGTPLVLGDQLLVMVGGSDVASQSVPPGQLGRVKPNRCGVVAFDKFSGEVNYQTIDDLASYSSLRAVETKNGPLVLALLRDNFHGFSPRDGEIVFSVPFRARRLESVNAMTPIVLERGVVMVSECYGPGSLILNVNQSPPKVVHQEADVRKKWLATHWATPVVSGDFLYCSSGRNLSTADLRCINWRTGELMWSQRGLGRCSLSSIDGHLVVVGESGELLLVQQTPSAYRVVTQFDGFQGEGEEYLQLKPPCWSAPVISHGLMWIRDKEQVVCFDLAK